jgi:hypothetical protein
VRIIAAFLVVAGLASGCGAAVSSDQKASNPAPASNPRLHRDGDAKFSVLIPRGWKVIDRLHPASPEFIATYRHDDPVFAVVLERMTAPDSPFYLFAYDPERNKVFGATMNVLSVHIDGDPAYDEFERGLLQTVNKLSTRGKPVVTREAFAAGDVLKASYLHDLPTSEGCTCLAVTQYALHANDRAYVVSFLTAASRRSAYAPVFERAARSFRPL